MLFGGETGSGGIPLNDTWEWDGTNWTQKQADTISPAANQPSQRYLHRMAYDAARGRVVLFGGTTANSARLLNDTWEWDGTSWTQKQADTISPAANQPSQRGAHALAYDTARQRVVLFGGYPGDGYLNDTWEWDGTTWARKQPNTGSPGSNQPSQRLHHGLVNDIARSRLVLFGGSDSGGRLNDTWEWDGTSWTQKQPNTSTPGLNQPGQRRMHALAYDSARTRTVLFAGNVSATGTALNDTWEYDGTNWTQKTPNGQPTAPSARISGRLIYDEARRKSVLFGGSRSDGTFLGDTWEWDGVQWSQRSGTSPPARSAAGFSFDRSRTRAVTFGGISGSGIIQDTWEFDGTTWLDRAIPPASSPVSRRSFGMAFDAARAEVVIFGGTLGSGSRGTDTWAYNGTAWTQRSSTGPENLTDVNMGYDARRGRTILFGGYPGPTSIADTWEWDGAIWTKRSPSTSPPDRHGTELAYDSVRERLVLFGGNRDTFCGADTWAWDGTTWSQWIPVKSPSPRTEHGLAYDRARTCLVLFGGRNFSSTLGIDIAMDDTWELPSNRPPRVTASFSPATPTPGQTNTHAAAFTDPHADTPTYRWFQTYGPPVNLNGASASVATFTPAAAGAYGFEVTADDGRGGVAYALGTVTVNRPPLANAGAAQTVTPLTVATLDGRVSSDPDNDPLTYQWAATAAPVALGSLTLTSPTSSLARFQPSATGSYRFRLTVADGHGASSAASATVEVVAGQPLRLLFTRATNPAGARNYIAELDGSNPRPVTAAPSGGPARWSPDRRKFAYVSSASGITRVHVVNADGSTDLEVENDTSRDDRRYPEWSADGRSLFFVAGTRGAGNYATNDYVLKKVDLRNGTLTTVPTFAGTNGRNLRTGPRRSPDGSRLVYQLALGDVGPPEELRMLDLANGNDTRLSYDDVDTGFEWDPVWSPDGASLLFFPATRSLGVPRPALLRLSDFTVADLPMTPPQHTQTGTFLPDGSGVVLASVPGSNSATPTVFGAGKLFRMQLDGQGRLQLTTGPGADTMPDLGAPLVPNLPPVASAGAAQAIVANRNVPYTVTLDGSSSYDPNGDPLGYAWTQTAGPAVSLQSASSASPSFTTTATGTFAFRVSATDGRGGVATTTATVTATLNNPPTADAGLDSTVPPGTPVTLCVTASDPDGDPLSYAWAQSAGPQLSMSPGTSARCVTVTPTTQGSFTFSVSAFDGRGGSAASSVSITVTAPAQPDIVALSISAGAATVVVNKTLAIVGSVRNSGPATSPGFLARFVLSPDNVVTTGNLSLGDASFRGLASGQSASGGGSYAIPASIAPRSYFVGMIVDPLGTIGEISKSNNTAVSTSTVSVTPPPVLQPNLRVNSFSAPGSLHQGEVFTPPALVVENAGNLDVTATFSVAFFGTDQFGPLLPHTSDLFLLCNSCFPVADPESPHQLRRVGRATS
ncbi:MAG: PKD domain-containing protein [Candidatus Wallbacteria bacterium]|nr:PKD domain-containing protein [Candidatus Wallbacteria bacterium]